MRVSLFVTCLTDVFFPAAAVDAVRLLRSLGVEVDFPPGQTCCGQPAWNAGQAGIARKMALATERVLRGSEHVVLPSGSCAAMLRKAYPELLGEANAAGHGDLPSLPERSWELAQFLVHVLGVGELGEGLRGLRVAYHHGCHALRELGSRNEPLALLRGGGADLVVWEADEECCGFGGLFSVKLPEVSVAMADRKLDTLPAVDVLTSADGGCLMQLQGRLRSRGVSLPVVPLASLLWRAREGGSTPTSPVGAARVSEGGDGGGR